MVSLLLFFKFVIKCKVKGKDKPSFNLDARTVEKLSELLMEHRRIHAPITLEKLKGGRP